MLAGGGTCLEEEDAESSDFLEDWAGEEWTFGCVVLVGRGMGVGGTLFFGVFDHAAQERAFAGHGGVDRSMNVFVCLFVCL